MPKFATRFIALLLVPALIVDPTLATSLAFPTSHHEVMPAVFTQQAIVPAVLQFWTGRRSFNSRATTVVAALAIAAVLAVAPSAWAQTLHPGRIRLPSLNGNVLMGVEGVVMSLTVTVLAALFWTAGKFPGENEGAKTPPTGPAGAAIGVLDLRTNTMMLLRYVDVRDMSAEICRIAARSLETWTEAQDTENVGWLMKALEDVSKGATPAPALSRYRFILSSEGEIEAYAYLTPPDEVEFMEVRTENRKSVRGKVESANRRYQGIGSEFLAEILRELRGKKNEGFIYLNNVKSSDIAQVIRKHVPNVYETPWLRIWMSMNDVDQFLAGQQAERQRYFHPQAGRADAALAEALKSPAITPPKLEWIVPETERGQATLDVSGFQADLEEWYLQSITQFIDERPKGNDPWMGFEPGRDVAAHVIRITYASGHRRDFLHIHFVRSLQELDKTDRQRLTTGFLFPIEYSDETTIRLGTPLVEGPNGATPYLPLPVDRLGPARMHRLMSKAHEVAYSQISHLSKAISTGEGINTGIYQALTPSGFIDLYYLDTSCPDYVPSDRQINRNKSPKIEATLQYIGVGSSLWYRFARPHDLAFLTALAEEDTGITMSAGILPLDGLIWLGRKIRNALRPKDFESIGLNAKVVRRVLVTRTIASVFIALILAWMPYELLRHHAPLYRSTGDGFVLLIFAGVLALINSSAMNRLVMRHYSTPLKERTKGIPVISSGFELGTQLFLTFFISSPVIFTNQPRFYEKTHPHHLFFHQDGTLLKKVLEGSLANVGDPIVCLWLLLPLVLLVQVARYLRKNARDIGDPEKPVRDLMDGLFETLFRSIDRYFVPVGMFSALVFIAVELACSSPLFLKINPSFSPTDPWDIAAYSLGGLYLIAAYGAAKHWLMKTTSSGGADSRTKLGSPWVAGLLALTW